MTIKEFVDLYNAALAGKEIIKKTTYRKHIEDEVVYEVVDFLNLDMYTVIYPYKNVEYFINDSDIDYTHLNNDEYEED